VTSGSRFRDAFETPSEGEGITQTYAVSLEPGTDRRADFRFYSCWEKSDASFADKGKFQQFINNEANRYANPVKVGFK
jgi:hypothetical protein